MNSRNTEHQTSSIMPFKKYQKLKAMQTFKQKFSEMTREYRDGFRFQIINSMHGTGATVKVEGKLQ